MLVVDAAERRTLLRDQLQRGMRVQPLAKGQETDLRDLTHDDQARNTQRAARKRLPRTHRTLAVLLQAVRDEQLTFEMKDGTSVAGALYEVDANLNATLRGATLPPPRCAPAHLAQPLRAAPSQVTRRNLNRGSKFKNP